jgi:hypothetical protein
MPVGSTPGTTVTRGVALVGATFVELEVKAEGLPLAVDQVADLGTRAESWLSVTKHILVALPQVRMGPAGADNTERWRLVGGTGARGMGGDRNRPLVRVGA